MSTAAVTPSPLPVPPTDSGSPGATAGASKGTTGTKRPAEAGAPAPAPSKQLATNSSVAVMRMMREFAQIKKEGIEEQLDMEFSMDDPDKPRYWSVLWRYKKLSALDASENHMRIKGQLEEKGLPGIRLGMIFPEDYPYEAPFVYLKGPHIYCPIVFGGGGFCAETLSSEHGWTSASRAWQLHLTLRALVESYLDVKLDFSVTEDHTPESARKNQKRIFEIHRDGWGDRVNAS